MGLHLAVGYGLSTLLTIFEPLVVALGTVLKV